MKRYLQLMAVTIFAALACTGLRAQTVNMWASIPFDFHAGGKRMPAGEYLIQEQGLIVVLHGIDKEKESVVFIAPADAPKRIQLRKPELDFNRYGSTYFLSAIWDSQTPEGRRLRPTARERELARASEIPDHAAVDLVSTK